MALKKTLFRELEKTLFRELEKTLFRELEKTLFRELEKTLFRENHNRRSAKINLCGLRQSTVNHSYCPRTFEALIMLAYNSCNFQPFCSVIEAVLG
jgi:hypothetical protein